MPDFYNMPTTDILAWLQAQPADPTLALDELLTRCGAIILTDLEAIGLTMATPSVEAAFDRWRVVFAAQRTPEHRLTVPDLFFLINNTKLVKIDY